MKKRELVIVALLIAFGFIYNAVERGKIRFADDFSRYFDERRLGSEQFTEAVQQEKVFPAPQKITIDNPAGEIDIDRSLDGQVHLRSIFRIYHADPSEVERIGRNAFVRADTLNNELKVSVNYPSAFPYRRLRIRFEMRIPEGVELAVSNSEGNISIRRSGKNILLRQEHGNVLVADIPSAVEVQIRGGNLDIRNIAGNVVIDARQGDIFLQNAIALHLKGRHGNYSLKEIKTSVFMEHAYGEATLDGAEQAEISGRHSTLTVRNIKNGVRISNAFRDVVLEHIDGDVHLSGRSSKMEIRHVRAKDMTVDNSFADIAITDCAGEGLNIILKNGNLTFTNNRFSERLNIESRQARLDLSLGELSDPTVNIKTSHGRITNASSLDLEVFREREENFANRSGQKPEIIISNSYGDIHLK